MAGTVNRTARVRRLGMGVSAAALLAGLAAGSAFAASLPTSITPARDNGGGSSPGRADIVTITGGTGSVTGNYALAGSSGRRFDSTTSTLAQRRAAGTIVSGYDAIDGQVSVALTSTQKTAVAVYPDAIRGTGVATNVYDNAALTALASTSTTTAEFVDTRKAVYGDLRLANISGGAAVTIATGERAGSVNDRANRAVLTADSGSTLYNVSGGSSITYDSRTAFFDGKSQDGFSQSATRTVEAPVTTFSGVAFGNGDSVTDLDSLKRYNTALIAELTAGRITPDQYESLIQQAATTSNKDVVVRQTFIPRYQAPATTSGRLFMLLDGSSLTTTAGSQLIGLFAENNLDGGSTLVRGQNGATIVNNGQIVSAQISPAIVLTDIGTSLTNAATGVIGVGYETIDRSSGALVPVGYNPRFGGQSSDNAAISATAGATVVNQGIINVANRDIAGADLPVSFGKANQGIVVGDGATASNRGTILIGGGASRASDTLGSYGGAAGMVATAGGTATNAAGGTIRVGTSFAENAADLAAVTDIVSINPANGMTSVGGGTIVNDGTIRIGGLTQNAAGMLVGGGGTATNGGAIVIDPTATTGATTRNAGISVTGRAGTIEATGGEGPVSAEALVTLAPVDAVNAAGGTITVNGSNGVGILVDNRIAGGTARAVNLGTIAVDGGRAATGLRSFGLFVDGASSSALQNGVVNLAGDGAIGVHARDGGTIDVGANAKLAFGGANEIGYYLLGAGSTIDFAAAAAPTVVDTTGSTGVRIEGGAALTGTGVNLTVSGTNATGIVASGAGTTLDTTGATIAVSGNGATGVLVEGGATGTLGANVGLAGPNTIAAIVDGQGHALDGTATGTPVATTRLTSTADLISSASGVTGYVARNQAQLANSGLIDFSGAGSTGILATTGATVANSGAITVGVGGTGIRLTSAGAADVVTGSNSGAITVNGGTSDNRGRGVIASGAGASATLQPGSAIALIGNGAIGAEAANGGFVDARGGTTPAFSPTATQQIAYHLTGAGSRISTSGALDASGTGSTLFRLDDGATRTFDAATTLGASGSNSSAIVANGGGTAVSTVGAQLAASGQGSAAVRISGGATATLDAATTITLGGAGGATGVSIIRDSIGLDGFGEPSRLVTSATSNAAIGGRAPNATGYILDGGVLTHGGTIALGGANSVGIALYDRSTATNSGSISLTGGGSSTGIEVQSGSVVNTGTVFVSSGIGVDVNGSGDSFSGNGAITANDGIAALRIANSASASTAAAITAGGTAHAVLLDGGADTLALGGATLTANGTGNGIENAGNTVVSLAGTTIIENGSGSGVRTAVNLDPASTGTVTAAGAGSNAFTFAGQYNSGIAADASIPAGLTLTATGAGANGLALNTTGAARITGTITVTNASGGSALIAGPASLVTNSGTLRSASTTAAVVQLTGITPQTPPGGTAPSQAASTTAFANTGTIVAASPTAVAIRGGDNGQAVTLASGSVTGVVQLGAGADTFVMSGGTLTGSIDAGAGDDSVTFRGLTDANLAGVTRVNGAGGAGGEDMLTFDATQSTGTRRLVGFNTVKLVNGSRLTADGDLVLAGSLMTIDRTSTFYAGGGANPTINGEVDNAGTIDLTNGSNGAGDTLTVRGNYTGGGTLRLDTVLNAVGPSDRLVIDGGAVSGTTTISIANVGGLGAQTTGNGIEVVAGSNGATTTATTGKTGFVLAGGHVDAGAFQYSLFASDPQGSQSWYLRSQAQTSGSDPSGGTTPIVTPPLAYRPEVALLTGLPQQLRHQDLDMVGTYHQRMGDRTGDVADGFTVPGRLWGRAIYDSYRIRNRNAGRSDFDGRQYGFQIGADVFEFGTGSGRHDVGLYGGYADGHANVRGFAGGLLDQYVGRTDPKTAYLAGYWSYLADGGFYSDLVVQASWYNGHALSAENNRIRIDGTGVLASVETGYAFKLSPRLTIEPQAQLVAQGVDLDHATIPNASISQHSTGTLTGRLGARLIGTVPVGGRTMQPYLRANLWKQFASTDRTTFATPSANTVFDTRTAALYGQTGAGFTLPVGTNIALYGEGDYSFTLDHGEGVTGHSVNGSIGVKMRF